MDMTWKPAYEEKYVAMGFSDEKISGIRYAFEEMANLTKLFAPEFK